MIKCKYCGTEGDFGVLLGHPLPACIQVLSARLAQREKELQEAREIIVGLLGGRRTMENEMHNYSCANIADNCNCAPIRARAFLKKAGD